MSRRQPIDYRPPPTDPLAGTMLGAWAAGREKPVITVDLDESAETAASREADLREWIGTPQRRKAVGQRNQPLGPALEAKRVGMAQAAKNSRIWRETATPILRRWLLTLDDGQTITTDTIRRLAGIPEPPTVKQSQAWWGPFVRSACTWGWLENTGREATSAQVVGHGNRTDVYRVNRAAVIRGEPKTAKRAA